MKRMAAEAKQRAARNHNFLQSVKPPQKEKPAWNMYNSPSLVPRNEDEYKKGLKQHKDDYRQRVASALKQRQDFKERVNDTSQTRQPELAEFRQPTYRSNGRSTGLDF
mmetsp:Transcript_16852/g.25946  ORF Transcript_16852/g.25946 Transcript_16852/m.25946 type:complete len:108 (+) Transcript_16852:520-843(+)